MIERAPGITRLLDRFLGAMIPAVADSGRFDGGGSLLYLARDSRGARTRLEELLISDTVGDGSVIALALARIDSEFGASLIG
jgi:hypothetical protein